MHYTHLSDIADSPRKTHSFLMLISSCTLMLLLVVTIITMKSLSELGPVFDDIGPLVKDASITLADVQDIMPEMKNALALLHKICSTKLLNITCEGF